MNGNENLDVSSSEIEITPAEYLRRYAGRMPTWLRDYRAGGRLPLRNFLRSSIAYYPGGRFDMNAVDVFGRSGMAHCIVYADYGCEYSADDGLSVGALREFFAAGGLPGYNLYDARSISEQELLRAAPWRPHVVPEELQEMRSRLDVSQVQRFAELFVFDRAGNDPDAGPERLAILYLGADGFATYDALFANGNAPKFVGMVLQDHGFGGNWDCFGVDGLLERIAQRSGVFPQFIHYGQGLTDEPWRGYALVPGVAPTEYRHRRLYARCQEGTAASRRAR